MAELSYFTGPPAHGETAQVIAYEVLCRRHHRRRLTRAGGEG